MFSLDILVPISIAFVSHHEHIFLHFHVFSGMDDNRFGHVACYMRAHHSGVHGHARIKKQKIASHFLLSAYDRREAKREEAAADHNSSS
jgi:hypothetical protein